MQVIDKLNDWLSQIAAWMFVCIGFILTFEVISRYFFNAPTIWAAEISQLLLIVGVYMALANIFHKRQHIAIDLLYDTLGTAGRWLGDVFTLLFVGVFSTIVAYWGWLIAWDSFVSNRSTGTMLDIPNWWSEVVIPLGFALLVAQSAVELWRIFSGQKTWLELTNEAGEG